MSARSDVAVQKLLAGYNCAQAVLYSFCDDLGLDIDPHFDLMYMFQVMDNKGNGKIYPDLAKETPYVVVKVDHATACKSCVGQ